MAEKAVDTEVRWVVDEMLGRLCRYLRFLGYDALYAKGRKDGEILEIARAEDRTLVTRDELLAHRGGRRAIRVRSGDLVEQLREIRRAYPALRRRVAFVRCTTCNGPLVEADRSTPAPPRGVPEDVWAAGTAVHLCRDCGQAYWEGGHTAEIRATLLRVFGE